MEKTKSKEQANVQKRTNNLFNITNLVPCKHKFASTFGWLRRKAVTTAFTMAEILLSLTIIGVVAAITLPALTGNINEKAWVAQKKALHSRLSQALNMLPALNGYGQYSGEWNSDTGSVTVTKDTAAETFVTEGLAKVLTINNICDNQHLQDCGINHTLRTMAGSKMNFPTKMSELKPALYANANNNFKYLDTSAAGFETQNGESIVVFYNPFCQPDFNERTRIADNGVTYVSHFFSHTKICANFLYDLNGKKGPNTAGKDIGFITAIFPVDGIVTAPEPLPTPITGVRHGQLRQVCVNSNSDSRAPRYFENWAMALNGNLIEFNSGTYWSVDITDQGLGRAIWPDLGRINDDGLLVPYNVRCVKR